MAKVGYARVSTKEQHDESQVDVLEAEGCERIFVEKVSGKLARRPEWDKCLDFLRKGDTLVITRLARMARSVRNLTEVAAQLQERGIDLVVLKQHIDTRTPAGRLTFHILGAVDEFTADLISEGTKEGLEAARARGRKGGRKPKMTENKLTMARQMHASRDYTMQQIAEIVGVSRATLYRHLEAVDPEDEVALGAVQHLEDGRPEQLFHAVDQNRGMVHDVVGGREIKYLSAGGKLWSEVPRHQRCTECSNLVGDGR
jgi:DNA invertase Pin-like site-specific DNA recombinase